MYVEYLSKEEEEITEPYHFFPCVLSWFLSFPVFSPGSFLSLRSRSSDEVTGAEPSGCNEWMCAVDYSRLVHVAPEAHPARS